MDKAAIYGNYADLKYIKTRSVVQVVVEVPIERANEVTDAFGWPQPGQEIPLALAKLDPSVVSKESPKEKRKFEDLPPSQQAGIECTKPAFQAWCKEWAATAGFDWNAFGADETERAAAWVRHRCEVDSRADLDDVSRSHRWHELNAQFEADTRLPEQR